MIKKGNLVNIILSMLYALCSLIIIMHFSAGSGYAEQSLSAGGELKGKIALFPFENLSDEKDALIYVMPVLKQRLEGEGFEIVDADSLNRFLLKERVRTTSYISRELARKIGSELNASAILLGSVYSIYIRENPQIGLSTRLVDSSTGLILWANFATATGEDFTKILGLGTAKTMDELVPKVVNRLFESFSTVPPFIEKEYTYKIAVMPFLNKSRRVDAGIIATNMFLVELFKSRVFETIEYGEVRRAIVKSRVRYKGELDYKSIKALSDSLMVDGILVGTVELYSDGMDTSSPPEVDISARLIDARENRILWYESSRLGGDDNIIIFDWGKIRAVDKVATDIVEKLTEKMEKVNW